MSFINTITTWFRGAEDVRAEITTSKQLEDVLIASGGQSFTGVNVTADTAMMVAAVSAAVSLLSETVAQIPLILYARRADGGKDRATDSPLWSVLHDRPNTWQNSFEFRELLSLHLLLWGNAYAFINRRTSGARAGQVLELVPIHPDRVKVEQDAGSVVTYRVATGGGETVTLPASRMFHIRDRAHVNGYEGVSRLKSGRDSIGLSRVTERWGGQLFGNSSRPSGILSTEVPLTEDQVERLRKSWKAAHGGENALGTAVLDGGLKWQPLAMNNTDAQFLETRRFQIAEIARIYRVPPHMLGDLERATFSNIEHQSLEFVKYSLMPWLRRWESAINTQLLPAGGGVFAEFLVDGLLRGDVASRYQAYAVGIQNKWLSANEIREKENLNPIPGGDVYENPAITPGPDGEANDPAQTA